MTAIHETAGRDSAAVLVLRLPQRPESVPVGRWRVRAELTTRFGTEHPGIDDCLQALSETLTNAVLYGAGTEVELTLTVRGRIVEVGVQNAAPGERHVVEANTRLDELAENGRGLLLVAAHADEWGVIRSVPHTIRVWFRISFHGC